MKNVLTLLIVICLIFAIVICTMYHDMKIMKAEVASDAFCIPHPAGTVAKIEDDKFFIATAKGLIVPTVLQFGSFFMGDSKDFIRIVNPKIGEEFK